MTDEWDAREDDYRSSGHDPEGRLCKVFWLAGCWGPLGEEPDGPVRRIVWVTRSLSPKQWQSLTPADLAALDRPLQDDERELAAEPRLEGHLVGIGNGRLEPARDADLRATRQLRAQARTELLERCRRRPSQSVPVLRSRASCGRTSRPATNQRRRGSRRATAAARAGPGDDPDSDEPAKGRRDDLALAEAAP